MTAYRNGLRRNLALSVSIAALGISQNAAAQSVCGDGSPGPVCTINNTGATGPIVGTAGTATVITNSGTITGSPAISQGQSVVLYVDNQENGTIDGAVEGNSLFAFGVLNAGEIIGSVVVDDTSPNIFTGKAIYYIADGGTVDGSVQLGTTGYTAANFIQRGADDDVSGSITAGNGLDIYSKSYASTQSVALGQYALPATFELEGYEVLGADTTLTLTGTGETIILMGDGNVVNEAEINLVDTTNIYPVEVVPAAVSTYEMQFATYQRQNPQPGQPSFYTIPIGNELTSFTNNGVINGDVRIAATSFTNNGEINFASHAPGTVIRGAADQDFLFRNTGSIVMTDNGARTGQSAIEAEFEDGTDAAVRLATAVDATELNGVMIENGEDGLISGGLSFTGVASDFIFTNDGEIEIGDNPFEIDRAVEINLGNFEVAQDEALREDAVADSVMITNNGTLDGGIEAEVTTRVLSFTNSGHINADVNDAQAAAVELATDDWADTPDGEDVNDAESVTFLNTTSGTIAGSVELEAHASLVTITNQGSITQALRTDHGVTVGANTLGNLAEALFVEQETVLGAELGFNNTGTISNADYAGGAVFLDLEAGDIGSGLPGAADADATVTITNSGSITASGGNYLTFSPAAGLTQEQIGIDFNTALAVVAEAEGTSSVTITNQQGGVIDARGSAHFWNGSSVTELPDQPPNSGGIAIAVADANDVTIVNHGTIRGGAGGPLNLPNGSTLVPINAGAFDFEGVWGGAIDTFGASADSVTNSSTGVIDGGIALRQGDDTLRNYGTITGDIRFGTGDDSFIQGINATFTGTADGGEGTDRFLIDITGGGTINNTIYDQLVNFEILSLTGTGSIPAIELTGDKPIEFGEDLVIDAISGTGTNDTLTVLGTVNGDVDLGNGSNSFTLGGTVNGDIVFGTGNDALVLQPGATLTGTATGGDGFDSLSAPLTGTYEEPTVLDLAQFESFEELNVTSGGVGTVNGDLTFETVNVDDGRLIGLADSTISGDVNVSSGGTFGSAGTVNGDVGVEGTLSPGSSPGTMTVNGNVTLASGSTTLFEMTPTVSDALVINGSLTIETGTTLDITGERPLTPGVTYNLITTTDGITGSFTTISKAETVLGFISQTSTALQLLGTFQLHEGANAQVSAANTYLNSLLINGQATAGLLAAVPDLVGSDGFASEAALATIHPEAYASASQIGVENGLAISSALRSGNWAGRGSQTGLFTFGQGFGTWRNFKAESGTGASKADVRSSGFFGGVGYGNKNVSVSAFIGRVDGTQSIRPIGARNDADGTFFGATAELAFAGFRLGGSVVRDHSSADTNRVLFNGAEATSDYRLRGTTADLHAEYGFAIGGGWDIGPEVGITYVSVKRGEATETGAGAFNLTVAKDRLSYTFLTADVALQMSEGKVRPWLSAGLRQRLDNDRAQATASLAGVSTSFTVPGVQRDRSFGNIGAGVAWQVSTKLNLFARGNNEFGSDNNAQSINAGLRLRF